MIGVHTRIPAWAGRGVSSWGQTPQRTDLMTLSRAQRLPRHTSDYDVSLDLVSVMLNVIHAHIVDDGRDTSSVKFSENAIHE